MVVGLCKGLEIVNVRTLDLKKPVRDASWRELKMAEIRAVLELPKDNRSSVMKFLGFFHRKQINALRAGKIDFSDALKVEQIGALGVSQKNVQSDVPTLGNYVNGLQQMYFSQM